MPGSIPHMHRRCKRLHNRRCKWYIGYMNLASYLEKNESSGNAFAARIGVPAITVQRYLKGRLPTKEIVIAIYVATDGEVTPNDFYPLPDIKRKRPS